jgi:uncharacterized membrane protein (UPF0127 family)
LWGAWALALLLAPGALWAADSLTTLVLPDGSRATAEVMDTPETRARGLMYRDGLPEGRLMLFRYDADGTRRVWMKNCRFAIDVAWLDAGGTVLAVSRGLPPCTHDPCPEYGPDAPARHFVEGAAGWLDAHGVRAGRRIGLGRQAEPPPLPAGRPE